MVRRTRGGSVLTSLALLLPAAAAGQAPVSPDEYRALADDLLRELIEINTTHSTGNTTEAGAHGQDERILARHFHEGQEFLYRLVKALSRRGTG